MNNDLSFYDSDSPFARRVDQLRDVAFSQRRVLLDANIESDLAVRVVLELESLRIKGSEPVRMIINSQGGEVSSGALIIASIREMIRDGIEVTAVVNGDADSMAAIIACSCSRIEMSRLGRMMLHGVSGITWGDVQDHESERAEMERITDELVEIVYSKVRNPQSRFSDRKYLRTVLRDKRQTWVSPSECLEAGIADAVVG